MNDEEFEIFLNSCFDELEKKQQLLIDEFDMGSHERFFFDFEKEEIYFSNKDIVDVKANIIPIGSFNTDSQTWMWAWANEAFPESLRKKSSKLRELEEITGFEIFANEMADIDDDMVWEITGMAVHLLKSQGAYRGPSNNTLYFYAIDGVQHVNS